MDRRLNQDRGFSLIELMIAVAVLAILSTTVVMSVSRPQSGSQSDLVRFQKAYERVRRDAIISREVTALAIRATGYQRLVWRDGWQELGTSVNWKGEVSVLQPFDRDAPIEFTPSGQVTALRIQFLENDQTTMCVSDGWEPLKCNRS